ncbi:hypothetical protein WR43_12600 [Mycolicibacter arupensis]|uniref:DUF732 domain-containing protein n=1 Tax=Mycolicibacter arupensis TaxID=342002 RepID=A0A0F5MXT3_9MYCO|nr:hypothetical protein WR43_12600 [Mycolicibacter arupensis]OQZ94758.1 hypothetical protein BST15_15700 [Mycolicibacter arupensis]
MAYGPTLLTGGLTITDMLDDDATQAALGSDQQPTIDLGASSRPEESGLAYSDHTSSIPVVDYEPPRGLPIWVAAAFLVMAALAVAAATFVLGRTTAPASAPTTASHAPEAPSVPAGPRSPAPPPMSPSTTGVLPPPMVEQLPAQPPTIVTVTTRAIPQIACDSLRRYHTMTMDDVAMIMVEDMALGIGYSEAKARVSQEVSTSCPELAR